MHQDCLFCKIVAGQIPSAKVYEDDAYFVFKDINPAAPVHWLVVPKRHLDRLAAAADRDRDLLGGLLLAAHKAAKANAIGDYRLIINDGPGAGQTVFHLHAHILAGPALGEKLL